MLTVRLPEKMEKELDYLVQKTNRSKSYYVKKAISQVLEDELDILEATAAYEDYLSSGKKGIPFEEVKKELGLDDND